jgi:hypothetical protein
MACSSDAGQELFLANGSFQPKRYPGSMLSHFRGQDAYATRSELQGSAMMAFLANHWKDLLEIAGVFGGLGANRVGTI